MTNATIRCPAELRTGYPDLLSSPNITGLNSDSFRNKARCTKYRIAAKHSINKLNDWVSTRKLPCCSLLLSSFLQRLKSLCQRIKVVFWGCSIRRRRSGCLSSLGSFTLSVIFIFSRRYIGQVGCFPTVRWCSCGLRRGWKRFRTFTFFSQSFLLFWRLGQEKQSIGVSKIFKLKNTDLRTTIRSISLPW